jgi:actin
MEHVVGDAERGGWGHDAPMRPTASVLAEQYRTIHRSSYPDVTAADAELSIRVDAMLDNVIFNPRNHCRMRDDDDEGCLVQVLTAPVSHETVLCGDEPRSLSAPENATPGEEVGADGSRCSAATTGAQDDSAQSPVPPTTALDALESSNVTAQDDDGHASDRVFPVSKPVGALVTGVETGHKEHSAALISANASHTASYSCAYEDDNPPYIFDIGSATCRAGRISKCGPWVVCSTSSGLENDPGTALRYRDQNMWVTDWARYDALLTHVFHDELRIEPQGRPMTFVESVLCPQSESERTIVTAMEVFESSAYLSVKEPAAAALGCGYDTALSVTIGAGLVQIAPVSMEANFSVHATRMLEVAGRSMTDKLCKEESVRRLNLSRPDVDRVKERLCYVLPDLAYRTGHACLSTIKLHYRNDDRRPPYEVALSDERWKIPEILFQPTLGDSANDILGLPAQIVNVIEGMNTDIRNYMYSNIVVTGGCARLPGLVDRLRMEVTELAPNVCTRRVIRVKTEPDQPEAAWQGASDYSGATMQQCPHAWISKAEYDDCGPGIVHRKSAV